MDMRHAVLSFLTNGEKLYRYNAMQAACAMVEIAGECSAIVAFDNEHAREEVRDLQATITKRFKAFGDRKERRLAPLVGAPRPQGTLAATVFIRPPPWRRPPDR
jgi:hypothetical protein